MEKVRLAVIAFGRGTTTESLINAGVAEVVIAITNNGPKRADIWERAKEMKFPLKHIPRGMDKDPIKHGEAILETLENYDFDWIFLNGCSFPVGENVLKKYPKVFNIHPTPLDRGHPDFGGVYGLTSYAWVKYFSESISRDFLSETTIHLATKDYDAGPSLLTEPYELFREETVEDLSIRALNSDHTLAINFCRKILNGGNIDPIIRTERLIPSDEISILNETKQMALADYPHG